MARTVADVVEAIAAVAPFANAADWDPVGLQLGAHDQAATRVAVAHEITERVVEALEGDSIDLVVVYHPLLFHPTNRMLAGSGAVGRAYRLVRHGVSLAVVHTAFDSAPGGAADALAVKLGLEEVSGFAPLPPPAGVGVVDATGGLFGRAGRPGTSMTLEHLAEHVSEKLTARVRVAGDRHRNVDRVAVVPGSGSDFFDAAAEIADVVVTGDVSHHRARQALDGGLSVIDAGHVPTERPGVRALYDLVAGIADEAIDLTDIDPDPWKE